MHSVECSFCRLIYSQFVLLLPWPPMKEVLASILIYLLEILHSKLPQERKTKWKTSTPIHSRIILRRLLCTQTHTHTHTCAPICILQILPTHTIAQNQDHQNRILYEVYITEFRIQCRIQCIVKLELWKIGDCTCENLIINHI